MILDDYLKVLSCFFLAALYISQLSETLGPGENQQVSLDMVLKQELWGSISAHLTDLSLNFDHSTPHDSFCQNWRTRNWWANSLTPCNTVSCYLFDVNSKHTGQCGRFYIALPVYVEPMLIRKSNAQQLKTNATPLRMLCGKQSNVITQPQTWQFLEILVGQGHCQVCGWDVKGSGGPLWRHYVPSDF